MLNKHEKMQCDIGMIGLGTMGRNLLLNMADHDFSVAGLDQDHTKVEGLRQEASNNKYEHKIYGTTNRADFIKLLHKPRMMMLLVPAGNPVDAVINEWVPHLEKGDIIIDAGNSHFTDTDRRAEALQKKGILFLGMGVSGGEEGARHGPSMMPGGPKEAYASVRPILEAVAAKVNNEPCVAYLGQGSVGHYVKMVHNGIEYAIMQLIAETYDLMKRGLGLSNDELSDVYGAWNKTELNSYLIEITSQIFQVKDEKSDAFLIDKILDVAKQNGTGMWTSQSAMALQIPAPTIDLAVTMRDLSALIEERGQAHALYHPMIKPLAKDKKIILTELQEALYAAMIVAYSQGMALLSVASHHYNYQLDLATVAKIWRGGCIIRAQLLQDIYAAFKANKNLSHLMLDVNLANKISAGDQALRQIVCQASLSHISIPGFMSTLGYLDAMRCGWLPANLIQAQRDYFGAHTYERIDMKGVFHTEWENSRDGK